MTSVSLPVLVFVPVLIYQRIRIGHPDASVVVVVGLAVSIALAVRQGLARYALRIREDQLTRQISHYRELAHTDPLTGLANRRGLQAALAGQAGSGAPYTLLSLDLDGFKAVNDRYGHDAGDSVLLEVARRLRTNLRPQDVAARLGGDEFAVLMTTGPGEAQRVAQRLTGVLSRPYPHAAGQVLLSVSIGVAAAHGDDRGNGVLYRADLALCSAKRRGKNRVECYDETYDELLRRRLRLTRDLPGAIERGELRLAYEPVVALPGRVGDPVPGADGDRRAGRAGLIGAEAVLRWYHPELGSIRTEELLPLIRESGLDDEVGDWLLEQAGRQLAGWLTEGYDIWVSVGVCSRLLHDAGYALRVADVLHSHQVPPDRLVLEVAERPAGQDLDELIHRLDALRRIGVRVALTGFGADRSSLAGLRRLPIDILKVHRSLLGIAEPVDPGGVPLLDLLVRFGDRLGLMVIAQGVDGPEELAAVTAAGCRAGQGQLFGWGVSARQVSELLVTGVPSTRGFDLANRH